MRLLLTRPLELSLALKEKLEAQGHEVFCLPLIQILPPEDEGLALKAALQKIHEYDWLVLTSQHAVRAIGVWWKDWPPTLQAVTSGAKTLAALRSTGFRGVCFSPEKKIGSRGMVEFLRTQELKGKKILYPRSALACTDWLDFASDMGAIVDSIVAYRTLPTNVTAYDIFCLLKQGINAVAFFSPSAVRHFFELIRPGDSRVQNLEWIPFGPTTAKALALSLSSLE